MKFNRLGFPALIAAALALPLLFSSPSTPSPLDFRPPQVFSGDEPHYLVMINSMVLDGDLDLANNYAAVHQGAAQAGEGSRFRALDHHTVWFENGRRVSWPSRYQLNPAKWDHDALGRPVPKLYDGAAPPPAGCPEYSTHP